MLCVPVSSLTFLVFVPTQSMFALCAISLLSMVSEIVPKLDSVSRKMEVIKPTDTVFVHVQRIDFARLIDREQSGVPSARAARRVKHDGLHLAGRHLLHSAEHDAASAGDGAHGDESPT